MIYASEILEAVKRGGSENWTTSRNDLKGCDKPLHKAQQRTEEAIAEVLNALSKDTKTVKQISDKTGIKPETVNKYLLVLMNRKKIKRSISKQPYQYMKV